MWQDAEGNELAPEEVPTRKRHEDTTRRASRPRAAREPQAPSWRRTFKRGLIFAPIMFVTVMLLSADLPLATQLVQTAIIVAIFVPFSYFLDGIFWRSYQRRAAREANAGRRG